MKFSDLKSLIEQGKLQQFEQQLDRHDLVAADINLLLRELIKNKAKKITPVFQKLIKKGADVNFAHIGLNKKSNLMVACEQGTIEVIQLLVQHRDIDFNLEDSMKKTAPYYAIENKNKNDGQIFLDKILKHAPHLINKPANNQTMLILAIKRQKPQLVRILLNNCAQPNHVIADSGNTPLHEAIKMCKNKQTKANKDIVKMLVEYGANPMIKNKKDKNVFEFADKFPLEELISEVQVRPRSQQEKISATLQNNRQKTIEQNTLAVRNQTKKAEGEQNKKSSGRSKKDTSSNENWRSPGVIKQKSRKDFKNNNKNKSRQYQNKQIRELRDYQRQNRQNKQNAVKLFSIDTQQDINQLIRKADRICDSQLDRKSSHNPAYVRKNNNGHKLLSEDETSSLCSQSSDSDSEFADVPPDQNIAPSYQKKEQFTASLSQQIRQLETRCQQVYRSAQRQFEKFFNKFRQIAYNEGIDVQLYGSFMTGLWYKNCDIDILLVPQDQFIAQKNPNYIEVILDRFQMLLKKQDSIKINNIMKNKKIKVPMLRLDIQFAYKGSKPRKIDITVFDRNHNGPAIAHYINENMKLSPQLKPLFFVIKSLTYHFKLNDPKLGGIRTYAIVIMILSFLQNERMKGTKLEEIELGQLLLRFLYFFGYEYQYGYAFGAGIDMKQENPGPNMEPKLILTIFDPLNHSNNLGNNAKAYELQSMFKAAFISLHSNIKQNKLQLMFGLKKICMF